MPISDLAKSSQILKDKWNKFINDLPDDNDEKYYAAKKKQEQEEQRKEIEKIVPKLYLSAKIDKSIIIKPEDNFYLFGSCGTGKTYYTYALMIDSIVNKKPRHTRFYFPDICNRYKNATFSEKEDIVEQLKKVKRLVFDDLGAEIKTDMTNELLNTIINYRIENLLYFSFVSNFSIGKLPYDDRIKSRIAGTVKDNKFEIRGYDRRINKR